MGKENSVISKEIENNALQGKTVLDVIAQKKRGRSKTTSILC
jgi:hypothetical protein